MFISTDFIFDDIKSTDMGLKVVQIETGMLETNFGVNRNIIEEKIQGKPLPYFYGIDEQPLSFRVTFAKDRGDKWTYEERQKLIKWLFQKNYKPFISLDNIGVAYYVIAVGEPKRYDNYLEEGYATIEFRANAPWGYSYPKSIITYDLTANETSKTITLDNRSNVVEYYSPELEFELVGDTNFSIKNHTVGGQEFKFTGLQDGEKVYVNNEKKQIISSLPNTYRYTDFNKQWLTLIQGENKLEITGKCNLQFRIQYPIGL